MVTSVSKLEKHIPDWDTNPYSHDAKAQRWKHITCIGTDHIMYDEYVSKWHLTVRKTTYLKNNHVIYKKLKFIKDLFVP